MQEELKTVWNGQNNTCQTEVLSYRYRDCALCALYVCPVVVTFVSLSIHVWLSVNIAESVLEIAECLQLVLKCTKLLS